LQAFFPEVHIYGQRIFAACAIHPIDDCRAGTRWLGPSLSREAGIPGLPNPEYFVAICGRNAGAKLPSLSTVYLDLRDDLLADVRSGGLTATGPADLMLQGGAGSPNEKLAIRSVGAAPTEAGRLREQVYELERERARQAGIAEDLSVECDRLTKQCQELEDLRAADSDRLTKQCQDLEALRAAEYDRLTKQYQDIEALRTTEYDSLTKQCQDLEALRAAEFDRADRAERELRASRRREAEVRLERENLAALPGEVAALTQQVVELEHHRAAEFERAESWRLEAQIKGRSFELLLSRLSDLQMALEEAREQEQSAESQLSALKGSTSWRVTAPLRQAASVLRNVRRS